MSRNKAITLYLIGSLEQIWMICIIVFILCNLRMVIDYTAPVGMIPIGIGGVLSALWGTIAAVKCKKSPNQRLSLIILLSVRVQELIKIVKCSMKGGKLNESN